MKRILCLLLAAVLLIGLIGCTSNPDPKPTEPTPSPTGSQTDATDSTDSTETTATEPAGDALSAYRNAAAALAARQDVSLTVTTTENLYVGDDSFVSSSVQEITYLGRGTEDFRASVTEAINYGSYETDIEEIYAEGTAYATVYGSDFRCDMTAEEFSSRYVPVLLIDESLYASHTVTQAEGQTHITFTEPTALESWIASDANSFISADAQAVLDADGTIVRLSYRATYTNAGGETSTEVQVDFSNPDGATIKVPYNVSNYRPISYLDGPRMLEHIYGKLLQAESITFNSSMQMLCEAANVYVISTSGINSWGTGDSMMTVIDYQHNITDYYNEENYIYEQTERFEHGKYTISVDGGSPTSDRSITGETITEYILSTITADIYDCAYFTEAVCTDLGSLLLIEFTGDSRLGKVISEYVSEYIFSDAGLLDDYASAFRTETMDYYIGVDKYLGLPTSIGVHFTGYHTIDGYDYRVDYQLDQAIYLASLSSYEYITEKSAPDTPPEESATPLFYHVTGPDGQEMWLLGTIHVGDDRTGYLPQEIYDAFNASDALAVECNTRTFEDQIEEDEALQQEVTTAYFYTDGSTTADHVDDPVLYDLSLKLMKATGNYFYNAPYLKVAMWAQCIDNYLVQQGYALTSDKGMDNRLLMLAEASGKPIWEVESNLFQLKMLSGWSEELSLLLLQEAVSSDFVEYTGSLNEMYELWCSGDEAALTEYLTGADLSELTPEELELYEEYSNAMSSNRNKNMIDVAIEYLESGETVFYAVGLAHVLEEDGLVNGLRDAGYTVELVAYQ